MNIWIISPNALPPSLGGLNRHFYFKKYLEKNGHKVNVFTWSTIYNKNQNICDKHFKFLFKKEVFDNQEFIFVKVKSFNSTIKRLLRIHEFCKSMKKIAKKNFFEKPDIIYASFSPEVEVGLLAHWLSRFYKIPHIIETRDIYPETLSSLGVIKEKNLLFKIYKKIVKTNFERAEMIFFTMDNGPQYIVDNKWDIGQGGKVDLAKVHIVHNGFDYLSFKENLNRIIFKNEFLDNKSLKTLVYTGSIGQADGVDRIIEISKRINNKDVMFLIWGCGKEANKLKQLIEQNDLKNIKIYDAVDGNYIPSLLSKAYLLIMNQKPLSIFKYGISSNKSFQYLASGKPICMLMDTCFDPIENGCGIKIPENDIDIIAQKLSNYLDDLSKNDFYDSVSNKSFEYSNFYRYENIAKVLEKHLESLLK